MDDRRPGYDADWFREALKDKGIRPGIPGRKSRGRTVGYGKRRYRHRNRIEIMFARLKDWSRVTIRYDRCAKTFLIGSCPRGHRHVLAVKVNEML